ncbi:MAG: ald, alanine dehydrogenase, alanine dehydrogenase [Deltaproteobacteria bacterium CSP1-8]|nr:MAG: ald, alanine dehydrogenase, alanine dehydrogenase [Deltaproteobacteria bacterium CSP1-8]
MKLSIGIPREIKEGENRVATTPRCVRALREAGARVFVQKGAGLESGFPDSEFARGGATIVPDEADAWSADLVVKVKEPLPREFRFLSDRTALLTYLHLAAFPKLADELVARKVTAIAYETVTRAGRLPLLRPMSEVAGILSVQMGARGLEKASGGRGILLSPVTGGKPASVCVIGAGTAGRSAARMAASIGASVTVIDISREELARVRKETGGRVRTVLSTPKSIERAVTASDLVISTVLIVGDRPPVLITRKMLRGMPRGAVVVDISIDQGGTLATSRPTTHADPFFVEEGVVHYCVSNMPAAVSRTSTIALTRATLPYVRKFARFGVLQALRKDAALRAGLNTFRGRVTCEGVAHAFGKEYTPPEMLLDLGERPR